ncbi:MAG: methionyl-tRNA formyltransferase [Candidatus Parcubacteria bacterium]|nr:methionyl-tRNA formyltransferase [Candidatus Parcubacteria bacterium]
MKKKLNFVFLGTPDLAVYVLEELSKADYLPSIVITASDMKVGRGNIFIAPPVKKWANVHHIPTLQPDKINEEFLNILRKEKYDIFILAAYGKILPKELIDMPKHGILNVHPSLLPRLRGPSPIRSAILNNERETGTSIIVLDEKMDHGKIVAQESIEIKDWPPFLPDLEEKLFRMGGKLLTKILQDYVSGKITPKIQDENKVTFCKKIKKEDGLIDILKDRAQEIWVKYRALYGWPGIYFMQNGKRIKITDADFQDGEFVIKKVIPENGKEIEYKK